MTIMHRGVGLGIISGGSVASGFLSFSNPDLEFAFTMDNIVTTTLVDETTNSRDGSIQGGLGTTTGKDGNALGVFDGVDDKVVITGYSGSTLNTGALSGWVTFTSSGPTVLLAKANGLTGPSEEYFYINTITSGALRITWKVGGSSGTFTTTNTFTMDTGKYYFVEVESNGTAWSMYVDGVLQATTGTNHGYWFNDIAVTDTVHLGWVPRTSGFEVKGVGALDHMRLFNRTLTSGEVSILYNEFS